MRYIIKINPAYEKYRDIIEKIIKKGKPENAEIIYEGRNLLYRIDLGASKGIVKDFRKPHLINSYAYTTVRKSKAARSYENALKMLELGFDTPLPIAYGEVRKGLQLQESYYISAELTDAREMRHWEEFDNADTLVPAFAKEILRLHKAGVWHKDFSPGNILYSGNETTGYKFHYVDLNRMKFGVHDREKLMSMFRSINLNPTETERLGRLYGKISGKDPEQMGKEALRQLDNYFAERKRKAAFKQIFK